MEKHSKQLKDFTSYQKLDIVKWCREKLNLSAATVEQETTMINFEKMEGGKVWLTEVNVNGKIVRP